MKLFQLAQTITSLFIPAPASEAPAAPPADPQPKPSQPSAPLGQDTFKNLSSSGQGLFGFNPFGNALNGFLGGVVKDIAAGVVTGALVSGVDDRMSQALTSAQGEWKAGVRELRGQSNRSPRIDEYAKNAHFKPEQGKNWCGFFVAFNYSQQGFKYPDSLASRTKAREFFLYGNSKQKRVEHRLEHEAQGNTRQYFMLPESPEIGRITKNKKRYPHINVEDHTFTQDKLPLRPGDTALFSKGHVGMVESYDPKSGLLTTIEGNTSGMGPDGKKRSQAVVRKTYDLSDPAVRAQFDGFGRPAAGDFKDPAAGK